MKFLITITKDVIDRSLMCGTDQSINDRISGCAFAIAYGELVPVHVLGLEIQFLNDRQRFLDSIKTSFDQREFICAFDLMCHTPEERYSLVGRTFEVEIPDNVIEYHYGDSVKAAQKIINNPILQTVNI